MTRTITPAVLAIAALALVTAFAWRRQRRKAATVVTMMDAPQSQAQSDAALRAELQTEREALLAAVSGMVCVFTRAGVLMSATPGQGVSDRMAAVFRAGASVADMGFPPAAVDDFLAILADSARQPGVVALTLNGVREADQLQVECRIASLDATRVLAICRDTTAQYAHDRQLRKMQDRMAHMQRHESLGRLVAGIAHDFNNLLAVIQTSADGCARAGNDDASASIELRAIVQAARHAADLIRQLQTYAGLSDMTFTPVNLNTLLSGARALLRATVPHNIALEYDEAAYLPDVVADATQMLQIVSNLVINAAEAIAANPGTIRLTTRLARREELDAKAYAGAKPLTADCYVVLSVSDTGQGISPTQIDRIHDPFFSTKGEGRGLGLATVAGILAAHDGAIAVSSRLGNGSEFTVVVPVPAATPAPAPSERADKPQAPLGEGEASTPCRILLVDDDARIRRTTRLLLESVNCEVLEAEGERDARLQIQKHRERIDGLLLDANVRGMDGVRALRVIQAKAPGLPAFLFSGHDEQQVRQVYRDLAFDGFIPKPFARETMLDMVARIRTLRHRQRGGVVGAT